MTITVIGIVITAIAIYLDKLTLFKHNVLPTTVLAGVLTIIASLVI